MASGCRQTLVTSSDRSDMSDLDRFTGTLPYASELFGVYQPLLGWKSRMIGSRYNGARRALYGSLAARALPLARTTC